MDELLLNVEGNNLIKPDSLKAITSYENHCFFTIKPAKFWVLNSITFNVYILYWFFQNWYFYQTISKEKFRISERAAAYPITFYCILMHVKREAITANIIEELNVGLLWGALIAASSVSLMLPFPFSLGYFLAPFPVLKLQKIMVKINESRGYEPYSSTSFSPYDFIVVVFTYFLIGGFLILLT